MRSLPRCQMCGKVSASCCTARLTPAASPPVTISALFSPNAFLTSSNQPFARLQRRRLPFVALDQLIDDRMCGADQHEHRLGRPAPESTSPFARSAARCRWIRDRDAPRDRSRRSVPSPSALSRTSTRSGIRLLSESASAPSLRRTSRGRSSPSRRQRDAGAGAAWMRRQPRPGRGGARQIDRDDAGSRRAQANQHGPHVGVRQRPLRVAAAGRFELVERDLRLHDIAEVGHLQVDGEAIDAVGVAAHVESAVAAADAALTPLPARNCFTSSGDFVGGRALRIPDVRQVASQHHRGGVQPGIVPAEQSERRFAARR